MTLKTMFVLGHTVRIEGTDEPELPYQFQAVETVMFNDNDDDDKKAEMYNAAEVFIVDIVMSLGGSESALYRYPKEGERVLVGIEEDNYYLMGYMPKKKTVNNEGQDDIFTGNKGNEEIIPDQMAGQFFRYKGPNDSTDDKKSFSEIGFYNEQTKWKKSGDTENPDIDTLKITSSGDINQRAENHNQIKAKRFELLVNCNGSNASDKDSKAYYGLGDKKGDDPALYAGDAHIRAKNRVVIKAEKEIIFQVGRSTISIDDTGIRLLSQKSSENSTNSWDTQISLDPTDGVTIQGQKIYNRGGTEVEMTDAYGGFYRSSMGVARVQGMDIKLSTISTKNYTIKAANQIFDLLLNTPLTLGATMSMEENLSSENIASHEIQVEEEAPEEEGPSLIPPGSSLDKITKISSKLLQLCSAFVTDDSDLDTKNEDAGGSPDPMKDFMDTVKAERLILISVRYAILWAIPDETLRKNPKIRDLLYLVFSIIDYGIIITSLAVLIQKNMKSAVHESSIYLKGSDIKLDGTSVSSVNLQNEEKETPAAGFAPGEFKEIIVDFVKKAGEKAVGDHMMKVLAEAGVIGLIDAGDGTAIAVSNDTIQEELNSL